MKKNNHLLAALRQQNPLIHCISNIVVANFQANGLLALGASPIMADAMEEVAEIAAVADATVLNMGTLNPTTLEAMIHAGKSATERNIPVVIDPVGVGATTFRKQSIQQLLQEVDVTLIRCNAGELAAIAGVDWTAKGVDAGVGDADIESIAKAVAKKHNCLLAVSGEIDIVTDGYQTFYIEGGHPLMTKVTGTGCLLSSVVGAFLAAAEENSVEAAATALTFYKKAGEKAAALAVGPGDFAVHFLNALNEEEPTH
ncbi:hydroxyethylthiazole kinase [Sporosarcina pasteurii]|uniref:Hydroxyethylthiazole kinase n=1 Tax=Sporosarcina pasteurii TaxID=1474 RepID=A0A380CLA9_SPOPA|nr:hydroxyethylthiazole kinase [Sporosarcina pasteurii]MDS9471952.1 hydroxyethylthiazole kinase [Sporosarcina pasteurii]QBQ06683.1 hydroxyethylthiazole kinase [Sporosarcina pasteurii]SUJ21898.1 Hydroxyethylthiazole kinase [Sporosarcina pasteurii]